MSKAHTSKSDSVQDREERRKEKKNSKHERDESFNFKYKKRKQDSEPSDSESPPRERKGRPNDKYSNAEEIRSVGPRYYGEGSVRERLARCDQRFDEKENYRNKRRRGENERDAYRDERNRRDTRNCTDDDKTKRGLNSTKITDKNKLDDKRDKLSGDGESSTQQANTMSVSQKKTVDILTSRTGGAYIPPAKLRLLQAQITDKASAAYQRIAWEALKKSIHGQINKVNTGNIIAIVKELMRENVVRGRGLLCRSIIQAQAASPTFTHVYAALVAVINCKFPNIGELLLKRLVIQFRRAFKRNDKSLCISAATFVAHLVNQRVAHEILALEILTLLVESPTDDSVEVSIAFLKECGHMLKDVSKKGINAIFEMLRNILHEGQLDKRVQYMIEVIFQVRKDDFRDHPAIIEELDLVMEVDQFTHLITLDEATDAQDILNVFKFDEDYEANEGKYGALRKEILASDDESTSNGESGEDDDDDEDEEGENGNESKDGTIIDNTETNLVALRRTIYLIIRSSLDFEECAHKLFRLELKPGQEVELCHMVLDYCAEERTYEKMLGLLAQRFCQVNKTYIVLYQQIFKDTYDTIHHIDTNKLRNIAKCFAHLLFTDAISWEVLSCIRLNEEETTSSSRIFIKILFQELSEYMGLSKLNERVKDPTLQLAFDGLFPRNDPKNTRFAINFFTSIGLGGLTDELREHLKSRPKTPLVPKLVEVLSESSNSDSSEDSSSESDSDSSSDSSSDSEDSEDNIRQRSKRNSKKSKSSEIKSKSKKHRSSNEKKTKKKAIQQKKKKKRKSR